jgi:hypothetical protein
MALWGGRRRWSWPCDYTTWALAQLWVSPCLLVHLRRPMDRSKVPGLGLPGPKPIGPALGLGLWGPKPVRAKCQPGLFLDSARALGSKANRAAPAVLGLGLWGPRPNRTRKSLPLKSDSGLDSGPVRLLGVGVSAADGLPVQRGYQSPCGYRHSFVYIRLYMCVYFTQVRL